MSRKSAVSRLFSQYRAECCFGWYDPHPACRSQLRELYPIDYVAAHHRGDQATISFIEHAQRLKLFHKNIDDAIAARRERLNAQ